MSQSKKSIFTNIILLIGAAGIGFLTSYIFGEYIFPEKGIQGTEKSEQLSKPIFILGSIMMVFVVLAVHELGHLLTGLFQGFQFQLFIVGFLGVKREEDNSIRPYFNKDLNMFGGVASSTPTVETKDVATKFGNVLLAGPVASVIFAILCFLFSRGTNSLIWSSLWGVGSLTSFLIFLVTTLPSKTGIFYTDRKRYQRLTSGGIEQEIEIALLETFAIKTSGRPITDMRLEKIQKIKLDESPVMKYSGYFYELEYCLEKHPEQIPAIKEEMEKIAKDLPKSMVQLFEKEIKKLSKDSDV